MAHSDKEIAECQERLAFLLADRDAENAALNAPRPAGIPTTWKPYPLRTGHAQYVVVAWHDPDVQISAHPLPSSRGAAGVRP